MALRSLFLDLNSFFASVEQQERPELRGRPVGVAALMVDSTCCLAASYEAKRFGVKTGTNVAEARRMCPGLVIVESRPEVYIRYHHRVLEAVDTCMPVHKVWSVDEMECRLLGREREPDRAIALALSIKRAILQRVGERLTCSIGLAPNRVLAKTATDMQKPNGLVVIQERELPGRLYGLKLDDLPGIGPRMLARLNGCGIYTMEELCGASESRLAGVWGSVVGRYWWHQLRGRDVEQPRASMRSIGHQHVLAPELRHAEGARAVMLKLIHKAAARLRHEGYRAGAMSVGMKYVDGARWEDRVRFAPPCCETVRMVEEMGRMWSKGPGLRTGSAIRAEMTLTDLEPVAGGTLPLFESQRHAEALATAMDKINGKFGRNTIFTGDMSGAEEAAPVRIPFQTVPDLAIV